jgi:hypothetical protein
VNRVENGRVAQRDSRYLAVLNSEIVRYRMYTSTRDCLHMENDGVVRVSRQFRKAANFFRIREKLFKIKRQARDP